MLIDWRKFYARWHLKQPVFIDSACGPFTKHCERIQKFRKTGNLNNLPTGSFLIIIMQTL